MGSMDGKQELVEKKTFSHGQDDRQCVDVYLPLNRSTSNDVPLLIFIHGGAWVSESTEMYAKLANAIASKGIAVVLPEYRLTRYKNTTEQDPNTVWHPDHLQDVYNGIQLVYEKANTLGINTDQTVLVGHSAGAWMALAIALESESSKFGSNTTRNFPAVDRRICKSIKAFVCVESIISIYDMLQQYPSYNYFTNPVFYSPESQKSIKEPYSELRRAGPEAWPIRSPGSYHSSSPDKPNIYIIHSSEDTLLDEKYCEKGVELLKSKGLQPHIDTQSFKGDHEDLLHTQAFWNRLIEIMRK